MKYNTSIVIKTSTIEEKLYVIVRICRVTGLPISEWLEGETLRNLCDRPDISERFLIISIVENGDKASITCHSVLPEKRKVFNYSEIEDFLDALVCPAPITIALNSGTFAIVSKSGVAIGHQNISFKAIEELHDAVKKMQ